ncbi:MAG: hypothetical protein ACK5OB_20355 [Pirellula sp.]|jgi:hypothetical protein
MVPLEPHSKDRTAEHCKTHRPSTGSKRIAVLLLLALGCNGSEDRPRPLKEALEAANQKAREISERVSPPTQKNAVASRIARTPDAPVELEFSIAPTAARLGDGMECRVVLDIESGWSVHPLDAAPPAMPTKIELELPPGITRQGNWQLVSGTVARGPQGEPVIDGRAEWKQTLRIAPDCEPGALLIGCSVRYQACNAKQCLRPISADLGAIVELAD